MSVEVQVRVEGKRGCGYRRPGLYVMGGKESAPCGRLPVPLTVCPCCSEGIKPARGWTWVQPRPLLAPKPCATAQLLDQETLVGVARSSGDRSMELLHRTCPLADANLPARCGMLWIGEAHYETPAEYMREARDMGISRRIKSVPKDFVIGKDLILLAHRKCIQVARVEPNDAGELFDWQCGIFTSFTPDRIEVVVNGDETDEDLERLVERGLTPVKVINPGRAEAAAAAGTEEDEE